MAATIIVLAIVAVVAVVAFKSYKKTLSEGCCGAGGGSTKVQAEEKALDGPVVRKVIVNIEGMTCENCSGRIQKRLNKIDGVSALVDHKTGKAVVSMDREVSDNAIRTAIVQLDYKVLGIEQA